MARTQKLKVFRTPIGFHDAYIAAPSQKAALEAWGSRTDLFSTGAAERVEDDEPTREPLAHPGTVFRRLRGTMAEHLSALPKESLRPPKSKRSGEAAAEPPPARASRKLAPRWKRKPQPDRAALAKAEVELADATARYATELAGLEKRQAQLDRERRAMEDDHVRQSRALERKLEAENTRFDRAMRDWRAD